MPWCPSCARVACLLICGAATWCHSTAAQTAPVSTLTSTSLTLDEAIRRAEANEPLFASALAENRALALERKDARAALLPTATYHNQVIYTQPNGLDNRIGQTLNQPTPIFIANNSIREYVSQGVFTETAGLVQVAAIRLADANAARATAELEVARRGLVATVVSLFYSVGIQAEKVAISARALDEANHFLTVTQQREAARESAHADVIKATNPTAATSARTGGSRTRPRQGTPRTRGTAFS